MNKLKKTFNNITNSEYKLDIISTLEKFYKLKNDWNRLYNLNEGIPLFLSYDVFKIYYEIILKNFKNIRIRLYTIKNKNNKIIAIFPFTLQIKKYFFLSLKVLSVKDEYLIGFYNFLIDQKENTEIIINIFIKYLKENKKEFDIFKIYLIPEDEKLYNVFTSIAKKYNKIDKTKTKKLVIDCQRGFNHYINDLEGKNVREIKRKCRRLDEQGFITLKEIKKQQEIEKELEHFYDIEDSGWKGAEKTSLKRSYYGEFYQKLAFQLAKEDKFRLYFLKLNDEYIAGIYAIIDRGNVFFIKIGYLNTFTSFSPSNVLFYRVLEKLFSDEKIWKIDFYGEYSKYQKVFGKQTKNKYIITIFPQKILPTINYVFLKIFKKFNSYFQNSSMIQKTINIMTKHFYISP